jgi:hypothetical protein
VKVILETIVGVFILAGMLVAVDCLPGMSRQPQHQHLLRDAGIEACAATAAPALLCNATTKTSPPRECVICPDPARHCVTVTGMYCSTSCDEPLCERRPDP